MMELVHSEHGDKDNQLKLLNFRMVELSPKSKVVISKIQFLLDSMTGLFDSKLKGDIEKTRILLYFHSIL